MHHSTHLGKPLILEMSPPKSFLSSWLEEFITGCPLDTKIFPIHSFIWFRVVSPPLIFFLLCHSLYLINIVAGPVTDSISSRSACACAVRSCYQNWNYTPSSSLNRKTHLSLLLVFTVICTRKNSHHSSFSRNPNVDQPLTRTKASRSHNYFSSLSQLFFFHHVLLWANEPKVGTIPNSDSFRVIRKFSLYVHVHLNCI